MTSRKLGAFCAFFLVVAATPLSGLAGSTAPVAATPTVGATPAPSSTPSRPAANGGVTPALVVDDVGGQTLLGLRVQTSKGEDLGHVVDVVVARSGAMLAAIVDFGGFLGVGSRKIAVDWRLLHFPKTDSMNKLVADLTIEQVRGAPAYKPGEPIVVMGAPQTPSPAGGPAPSPAAQKP